MCDSRLNLEIIQINGLLTSERVYILVSLYPKMAYFLVIQNIRRLILSALCAIWHGFADFLG